MIRTFQLFSKWFVLALKNFLWALQFIHFNSVTIYDCTCAQYSFGSSSSLSLHVVIIRWYMRLGRRVWMRWQQCMMYKQKMQRYGRVPTVLWSAWIQSLRHFTTLLIQAEMRRGLWLLIGYFSKWRYSEVFSGVIRRNWSDCFTALTST